MGAVALGPRVRVAARLATTAVARVTLVVTGRGARRAAPSGVVKRVAGGSARPGGCGCGGACAQRGKAEPDEGEPGVSYLYWAAAPPGVSWTPLDDTGKTKDQACLECYSNAINTIVKPGAQTAFADLGQCFYSASQNFGGDPCALANAQNNCIKLFNTEIDQLHQDCATWANICSGQYGCTLPTECPRNMVPRRRRPIPLPAGCRPPQYP
jgi:hypothetical protein